MKEISGTLWLLFAATGVLIILLVFIEYKLFEIGKGLKDLAHELRRSGERKE